MNAQLEACRHIIFDIGNVLLAFAPERALEKLVPEKDRDLFRAYVLEGQEWVMLDRGDLNNQEAAKAICRHMEMLGREAQVLDFLNGFPATMVPLPASAVFDELHAMGKSLYALSNFHAEAFQKVYRLNPFFEKLDGKIISSHVHCLKPEPQIYQLLLKKYGLEGDQCLFLDDVSVNVLAAEQQGIHALQYTNCGQIVDMMHE